MSKVLHCIASLRAGGVERRVMNAVLRLAETGSRHQHSVCAFQDGALREVYEDKLRNPGVDLYVHERASRYSLAFYKALRRTANVVEPDIIHAYNETAGLWTRMLLGGDRRWKIIIHCGGGGALRWRLKILERLLKSRADQFVFNSQATSHVWRDDINIRDRYRVIYNGVDIDNMDDGPLPMVSPSPFRLLTVCRVVAIKNLSAQIRAVRLLHDRGQNDVQLTIVGDGPGLDGLRRFAAESGVADFVTFAGYQADTRQYHAGSHVYICSSYNETFGLALAEAMLGRMVCVAPSVGGPSEIIRHRENGFLVGCSEPLPASLKGALPHGQTIPGRVYDFQTDGLRPPLGIHVEALADQIEAIRTDYENMATLRKAARQRIVEDFSLDAYCAGLENLYDELSQDSSR